MKIISRKGVLHLPYQIRVLGIKVAAKDIKWSNKEIGKGGA